MRVANNIAERVDEGDVAFAAPALRDEPRVQPKSGQAQAVEANELPFTARHVQEQNRQRRTSQSVAQLRIRAEHARFARPGTRVGLAIAITAAGPLP
jgi:hypothetical protein